jgi:hypothetical protein
MIEFDRNRDEESLNNYKNLKNQLEQALKKVKQAKDFREAKGFLIEVQNSFKGLRLLKEDREELYGKLQDSFAELNKKIEDERTDFNNQALQNYTLIKEKVDEALFLASHPKDFKETWDYLIEVQNLFKGAKLLREHRENLYARLQEAFVKIKGFREIEQTNFEKESAQNYIQLKQNVEEAILQASQTDDFRIAKDVLIKAQNEFRTTKLTKEQRDELYSKLQDAFTAINIQKDEESAKHRQEAENNYNLFNPRALDILKRAGESTEFHQIRMDLKEIQAEIRDAVLLKEHRETLHTALQEAFETLNLRQDDEKYSFEHDAQDNYKRLKAMVNDGLKQAEESVEYKETREYLKKIQSEFKGIKLIREQREELYSRLQSAFETLNKRVDEYFHEKKKNWEVKMQYKLSALSTDIFELNESLEKDFEVLQELEDHLDIIESSGKDTSAALGLKARISSTRISIDKKKNQIKNMELEMNDLKNRLEPEE